MKNKLSHILLIATLLTSISFLTGCSKFLDVNPSTTSVNPTRIKDFKEMLNSDSTAHAEFLILDIMSDDVLLYDNQLTSDNAYLRSYLWRDTIWNPSENDIIYNSSYQRILQMNIILDRLPHAPKDEDNTEENRKNIQSQALINRAWYYLQLVNTYGKDYTKENADKDLGVPLILVPNANLLLPRASVSEVYAQIVNDLNIAVNNPYLPSRGVDIIHPGKAAGYALLARTHLYMKNYTQALIYADSSLSLENTLQNYNNQYTNPTQLIDLVQNPEVLLGKITADRRIRSFYNNTFKASKELIDSMRVVPGEPVTDIRYTKRFPNGYFPFSVAMGNGIVMDNSINVPEVMLIKAECLARTGNFEGAGKLLDNIRSNRIPNASLRNRKYTQENTLSYVLGERRRELAFHGGLRWFDIKRLNHETNRQISLVRTRENANEKIAILEANSDKFALPFSSLVIAANPNIVQNPRK
jgi:tetratricopeptide (TPR) repeat protein